ncbi:sigma-54-dependent Fis family transcriptional regulator [Paracoccus seriniphilus]|uniref:Transcriptional regulator of acetoin/glycerol metabolism n=1 Tax=Paracoccus seriniphilus TaxID=184748 RepID=A0A239PV89_9RHOB|nr:helix-turn-helix domain-containing protein [Paracoccus seriniphilus]WCR15451.1 GAF domain-containing protein [Paracoccus seriniphilus]SNT73943.1 Transcriptional regulator of acetoin/glycerol metabolism [Paracoccus seriniphilus]
MVGLLPREEYRIAVERSWRRCLEWHLPSDARNPILRLQQTEVRSRRQALLEALGDIRADTDRLAEITLKAGHCLVITDPEGIAIETHTGRAENDLLRKAGIVPGSCWSEKLAGTNGVSLALKEQTIFTVCGKDHYFRNLRDVACSAVPLRAADGRIMGALAIICVDRETPVDYILAQSLLSQTADRIEARLFARTYSADHLMLPLPGARRGALLALDDKAMIVAATHSASLSGLPDGRPVVGQSYEDAFETRLPQGASSCAATSAARPMFRANAELEEIAIKDPAVGRAVEKAERLLALKQPLLLLGQQGTGKKRLAEALLRGCETSVRYLDGLVLAAGEDPARAVSAWLVETDRFLAKGAELSVLLSQLEALPSRAARRLAAWLARHERDGRDFTLVATAAGNRPPEGFDVFFPSHVVRLPALAERRDLASLIQRAHRRLAGFGSSISAEAMQRLTAYGWPGNLRELEDVLTEMVTVFGRGALGVAHLPGHISCPETSGAGFVHTLESALAETHWNVSRAARLLGLSRATINRRIKAAGLVRPEDLVD